MKNSDIFDVLIVYSSGIAKSPTDMSYKEPFPFDPLSSRSNYNISYSYFIETCRRMGLKAAFCASDDIVGAGSCKSYWMYENKEWKRVQKNCFSNQIFDKFSPRNESMRLYRDLLFSSDSIHPFNNAYLFSLFFDKLKSYEKLSKYTIPTTAIDINNKAGIKESLDKLQSIVSSHPNKEDFSKEIILKDRFGAGGNYIFKITSNHVDEIFKITKEMDHVSFILQPFVNFENGFSYKNKPTATDIRLIYLNGKILQTYIRMAKENDFRCNEHKGGTLLYVNLEDIPKKVQIVSEKIYQELDQGSSLFALDFIISNQGNVYFLEGNIGPGIDWNLSMKKNELLSKQLIEGIVSQIYSRIFAKDTHLDYKIDKHNSTKKRFTKIKLNIGKDIPLIDKIPAPLPID